MVILVPPAEIIGFCLAAVSLFLHGSYSCSMGTIIDSSDQSAILLFVSLIIVFIVVVVLVIAIIELHYLLNLIRKELKKK